MKNLHPLSIIAALLLVSALLSAQATKVPQAFKYQAVARDADNRPIQSERFLLRASIKDGGMLGTIYYAEDHNVSTSDLGVFNINIGEGMALTDPNDFLLIPWQSEKLFLHIALSFDNASSWVEMGESRLLSVPYALQAGKATMADLATPNAMIWDSDQDTYVTTEEVEDEDVIRFGINGEAMILKRTDAGLPVLEFPDPMGTHNLALGHLALDSMSLSANNNTAFGNFALSSNTDGFQNSAFGFRALAKNKSGINNLAFGSQALWFNTSGHSNTAVGNNSMVLNTESFGSVAVGSNALYNLKTGEGNTVIGWDGFYHLKNGHYNIGLGEGCGINISSGSGNIIIGFRSGPYAGVTGDFSDLILIGHDATIIGNERRNSIGLGSNTRIDADNQVRIGNNYTNSIGGWVDWSVVSDARVKKNIREDVPGINFVMQLRPVSFEVDYQIPQSLKTGTSDGVASNPSAVLPPIVRRTGFIAQEVEYAARQQQFLFSGIDRPASPDGLYGLRYSEFVVPLIKAVQEQQAQIEALQAENEELKTRLEALEKIILR